MNKKFIASVLAVTMLVGMSAPVMADTAYTEKNYDNLKQIEVSGNATLQTPHVKITVPTTSDFVINPYKVALEETNIEELGLSDDVLKAVSGNQIISRTADLKNESDVNVAVTIEEFKIKAGGDYRKNEKREVNGVVSGNWVDGFPITVASGSVAKKKNTVKSIQLSMVLKADKELTKKVTIKGVSDRKYDKKAGKVVTNAGVTKKRAIVIPKDKTGSITFTGSVNESPVKFYTISNGKKDVKKNEDDKWSDTDKVSVSYKLILTPTTLTK